MTSTIMLTKLDSLHRCLFRIESKMPANVETLVGDLDLQDIITLNLTRAVQVCVDIATHVIADFDTPPPTSMTESFERLHHLKVISSETSERMKKVVGFRNVSVREYQSIDWLIVYKIVTIQHLYECMRSTAITYVQRCHLTSLRQQPQPTCRADCVGF